MSFPSGHSFPQKVFNPWISLNKVYAFTFTIRYSSLDKQGGSLPRITGEEAFILKSHAQISQRRLLSPRPSVLSVLTWNHTGFHHCPGLCLPLPSWLMDALGEVWTKGPSPDSWWYPGVPGYSGDREPQFSPLFPTGENKD